MEPELCTAVHIELLHVTRYNSGYCHSQYPCATVLDAFLSNGSDFCLDMDHIEWRVVQITQPGLQNALSWTLHQNSIAQPEAGLSSPVTTECNFSTTSLL